MYGKGWKEKKIVTDISGFIKGGKNLKFFLS